MEQAARAIALCKAAGNIPVNLVGGNGAGKTTVIEDFVEKLNRSTAKADKRKQYRLVRLLLSLMQPGDFVVPVPNLQKGKVQFLVPDFLPFDTDEPCVVFADEVDRAFKEVQNNWLQMMLGGVFYNHRLSPQAFCIMAMNGVADIYTNPLSTAARTRLCSLFISTHTTGNLEAYDKWAQARGINPTVVTFRHYRMDLVEKHEAFTELALCVPRTADMAGKVLDVVPRIGFPTEDIIEPVLAGICGAEAASQLLTLDELCKRAPSPEEVLRNPAKARLPDADPSVCFALAVTVLRYHSTVNKASVASAKSVLTYAKRMEGMAAEVVEYIMSDIVSRTPEVVRLPEYIAWHNAHEQTSV
jgi:hypothetical protein